MARPARSPFTSATKVGTPGGRQAFDDALQGDGLAGAGRAGDQAVAVGALQLELLRIGAARAAPMKMLVVGWVAIADPFGSKGPSLGEGRPEAA